MNYKRIGRAAVCLLLVFSLLISYPARAEAIEPVSGSLAIGIAAVLILMAAGVVFHPQTVKDVVAIGNSMSNFLFSWSYTNDMVDEVDAFLEGVNFPGTGNGSDPDDYNDPDRFTLLIPEAINAGIALWIAELILNNKDIEVEGDPAPAAFQYYNNILMPVLPEYDQDLYPSAHISSVNGRTYSYLFVFSGDYSTWKNIYGFHVEFADCDYMKYVYDPTGYGGSDTSWELVESGYTEDGISSLISSNLTGGGLLWSNYDIYTEYSTPGSPVFSASEPTDYWVENLEDPVHLGDIPNQLLNGEITADDIVIPDIYYGDIIEGQDSYVDAITGVSGQLTDSSLSHDEYLDLTTVPALPPDIVKDLSTDPVIYEVGAITSPLIVSAVSHDDGEISYQWFREASDMLVEPLIKGATSHKYTPPSDIAGSFMYYCRIVNTNPDGKVSSVTSSKASIQIVEKTSDGTEGDTETGTDTVTGTGLKGMLQSVVDSLVGSIVNLQTAISNFFDSAVTGILEGLKELFLPQEDYITEKVEALCAEFVFADSIVKTAQGLHTGLAGVTTEPPVIYIDLGAAQGFYDIGGKTPFLDLRWYADYKPTVDTLISAFLWICFVWHMLLKLPGIISGMPGDFVMASVHQMGVSDYLPARSKEYEIQRISNRDTIRRGPRQ